MWIYRVFKCRQTERPLLFRCISRKKKGPVTLPHMGIFGSKGTCTPFFRPFFSIFSDPPNINQKRGFFDPFFGPPKNGFFRVFSGFFGVFGPPGGPPASQTPQNPKNGPPGPPRTPSPPLTPGGTPRKPQKQTSKALKALKADED